MVDVILVIGGLIVALVIWMIVRAVRLTLATTHAMRARIEPVLAAVREGRTPSPDEIHDLAANAATRSLLRRALRQLGRDDLFPVRYATPEALAESDMVVWLLHGNELGAVPDDIELATTMERTAGAPPRRCRYFVFRFRTRPPHWAASSGWMAGVAGPYFEGDEILDTPPAGIFSRFERFDARSPEEHLAAIARA